MHTGPCRGIPSDPRQPLPPTPAVIRPAPVARCGSEGVVGVVGAADDCGYRFSRDRRSSSGRGGLWCAPMTLSHDVTGTGPTVLLLHSTACDRRMWDPQMPVLAGAGYRAVRCDLRGYGDTPVPDRPWNDAADVAELGDRPGGGPLAPVGASGGGRVALEVAARWPGRVNALALLCTALAGHEPSPALRAYGERENALLEAGDVDAAVELNVQTWVGPAAGDQAREAVRRMQRRAFEVQLAADDDIEPIRVA